MASLLGAPCGLVDPGARAAAAATVAIFSVDASGNTLLMPLEGCDAGAVAGISRFFLVCAVVDGATSIVEFDLVMNGAAAAKHEFDSVFKQANGTAAACCLAADGSHALSFVLCHWMVRT